MTEVLMDLMDGPKFGSAFASNISYAAAGFPSEALIYPVQQTVQIITKKILMGLRESR